MKLTPLECEAVEHVQSALTVVAALMGDRSAAATPAFRSWLEVLSDRVATLQTVAMCERPAGAPGAWSEATVAAAERRDRLQLTDPVSPRAMMSPRLMVVERPAPGYAPDVPATASDARTGDTPPSGGSGARRPAACSPSAGAYSRIPAQTGTGPNCDLAVVRALAGGPCHYGPAGMPNLSAAVCHGYRGTLRASLQRRAEDVVEGISVQCTGVE